MSDEPATEPTVETPDLVEPDEPEQGEDEPEPRTFTDPDSVNE